MNSILLVKAQLHGGELTAIPNSYISNNFFHSNINFYFYCIKHVKLIGGKEEESGKMYYKFSSIHYSLHSGKSANHNRNYARF